MIVPTDGSISISLTGWAATTRRWSPPPSSRDTRQKVAPIVSTRRTASTWSTWSILSEEDTVVEISSINWKRSARSRSTLSTRSFSVAMPCLKLLRLMPAAIKSVTWPTISTNSSRAIPPMTNRLGMKATT